MARMFPEFGHKINGSKTAEPQFYKALKAGLDDSFVVIHSIPWLSSFVAELQNSRSPIGEIDFLIMHPTYGALLVEVKGGRVSHDSHGFYFSHSGVRIDPVGQLTKGMFALQEILTTRKAPIRFGRAVYFPDSEMNIDNLPPELVDYSHGATSTFVIDIHDDVSKKVVSIMQQHRRALRTFKIKNDVIERIINVLIPKVDYGACWNARIQNDHRIWLKLTEQQMECVELGLTQKRLLINGWPGSGKTIVLIQIARYLTKQLQPDKKILVLTYNTKLANDKIAKELRNFPQCEVYHFHRFCRLHASGLAVGKEWVNNGAYQDLELAAQSGALDRYDALIIDESQVIKQQGWESLAKAFESKRIIAMCDISQAFEYEEPVSLEFLEEIIGTRALLLATSLRVPKKVCNRMKLFNTPNYIVENPREHEEDSLEEVITGDQKKELKKVIQSLIEQKISNQDMCVLIPPMMSVPSDVVPEGISIENIGKFRGMEKPIVIIAPTPSMTDVEFFCAYSRATSKCIVLLDALQIKIGSYGRLGEDLLESRAQCIQKSLEKALTSTSLKDAKDDLNLVSINNDLSLYWSHSWGAYLLLGNRQALKNMLSVYLKLIPTGYVFTYESTSRGELRYISPDTENILEYNNLGSAWLKHCEKCQSLTPWSYWDWKAQSHQICFACSEYRTNRQADFEKTFDSVNSCIYCSDSSNLDSIHYCLHMFANLKSISSEILAKLIKNSSRLISCFIIIYILKSLEEAVIKGLLSIETKKLQWDIKAANSLFEAVDSMKWNGFFQDCLTKLENEGVLAKAGKGFRDINNEMFEMAKA